jgi:RNA polymerase sigma-70 factor (ECF subfamily)
VAVRADDVDLERDRDLVQRYQAGDPDAFDDLYRRYFDRLHGYCHRRVGDRHVAEELAQEAFVRALRAMPSFAGERRFYPWMTVIAQRLCIDHHRRRARVEPSADIDLGSVEPDHDALFAAVDNDHLAVAMERLAPRHREVLELREHEGLSYHEIAQRLDVPVSTVEALLHRARKALRREFMTVAGSGRLWGIPVLGTLAMRFSDLRARIGDRIPELAAIAAPAAAAIVTAAIVLAPAHPREAVTTKSGAKTSAATAAAVVERAGRAVASPGARVTSTSGARVASGSPAGPTKNVGGVMIFSGDDKQASREMADSMPTKVGFGGNTVAADPQRLVGDVTERLESSGLLPAREGKK